MLCSLSARCQQQMTRTEIPIHASLRGDGYERRTSERGSPRFRWKNERLFARGVALPAAVPRCNMRAPSPSFNPLSLLALAFVLLAALSHATWNISAKVAAESRHYVWLFSAGSVLVYGPVVAAVLFV